MSRWVLKRVGLLVKSTCLALEDLNLNSGSVLSLIFSFFNKIEMIIVPPPALLDVVRFKDRCLLSAYHRAGCKAVYFLRRVGNNTLLA